MMEILKTVQGYVLGFAILLPPILVVAICHELGHGYMAYMLGDDTAKKAGRLSFNPLKHIDLFGTVIFPILLYLTVGFPLVMFKPVPINARNFKNPSKDSIKVALAGPGANLLLIITATVLFHFLKMFDGISSTLFFKEIITGVTRIFVMFNFAIMAFNLLPIPPLDGSRVIRGFLPVRWQYYFQKGYTYFIIFFILLFLSGGIHKILGPAFKYLIAGASYLIK